MHSTPKLNESDPHDVFAIPPEVVPIAWADKVLADITRDTRSTRAARPAPSSAVAAAPKVDTTFRATAVDELRVANDRPADPPPMSKWTKSAVMLVLTLCSAVAAAGWQHYGDAARQMISHWTPAFTLSASQAESTGPAEQPVAAAAQADAAQQGAAPAQPAESAALAAPASDTSQLQSMARDLAAMAQQLVELKASIAELRASQQAMAAAKPVETKLSEVRPPAPTQRPRISPPPRVAAASAHRPMPNYAPVQATAPPPTPLAAPPPASWQPAPPPPQAATEPDGEPVVRPPMPLR